jgi:hypothetical protein
MVMVVADTVAWAAATRHSAAAMVSGPRTGGWSGRNMAAWNGQSGRNMSAWSGRAGNWNRFHHGHLVHRTERRALVNRGWLPTLFIGT